LVLVAEHQEQIKRISLMDFRVPFFLLLSVIYTTGFASDKTAASYWPWDIEAKAALEKPPEFKPYKLPTLSGRDLDYHDRPAALVKAPAVNADAVLQSVLSCYPAGSHWDIDVKLRAQLRNNVGFETDDYGTTSAGSNYVAIVASMPLYSGKELNREREREYKRRTEIAGFVADFIAAIAKRNHAVRELALYSSLEARASLRVQQGIVAAAEQVTYLQKVSSAQESLIVAESKIMETRLKMSTSCDTKKYTAMNGYLKRISAVKLQK